MRQIHVPDSSLHPLQRVDARVKLVAAALLLMLVVTATSPLFPLATAALALGVSVSMRIPVRLLLLRFCEPLFIALVLLILKSLSGSLPLVSINLYVTTVTIHADGLRQGILLASRITGGVAVIAAVGFSTGFTQLLSALSWLKIPREITEVALFAWRYLFVLADDAQVIHAAQKNRLGYVGLRRSLRSIGSLAGALVIKAFDTSQAMTTAMAQRGYDGNMPLMKHQPLPLREVALAGMFIICMAAIWKG